MSAATGTNSANTGKNYDLLCHNTRSVHHSGKLENALDRIRNHKYELTLGEVAGSVLNIIYHSGWLIYHNKKLYGSKVK